MQNEENGIEYFIVQTNILCETALKYAEEFKPYPDSIVVSYFGRCLAGFNSVRTILSVWNNFVGKPDFANEYAEIIKDLLPEKASEQRKAAILLGFTRSLYTDIRFLFFHSFYSQTEATFKIIMRNKFPNEPKKSQPFTVIRREYGVF